MQTMLGKLTWFCVVLGAVVGGFNEQAGFGIAFVGALALIGAAFARDEDK